MALDSTSPIGLALLAIVAVVLVVPIGLLALAVIVGIKTDDASRREFCLGVVKAITPRSAGRRKAVTGIE